MDLFAARSSGTPRLARTWLAARPPVSSPAVQMADSDANASSEQQLESFVRTLEGAEITPEAYFLKDERAVIRFVDEADQQRAADRLRARFGQDTNVALTLAPPAI